jgi:DNA polymerase
VETPVTAHHDFETRSTVDLPKSGSHRYFEHPTTGVWMMSWGVGDGPIHRWHPGDEDPIELLAFVEAGGMMAAHNAAFERLAWAWIRKHLCPHWPPLLAEQQDCTMARAVAMALPAGLDQLAVALKTRVQKDKEGSRLMMQMCRPRRVEADGTIVWWDDAERIARLGDYCDQDVDTERHVDKIVPFLTETERRVWLLDQKINDRGVMLDTRLASRALDVVGEAKRKADDHMWFLTDGDVKKCTETAKIVAWLNKRGVPCTSVAKGEVEEIILTSQILGDDVAQEVIELRRAAAKSSTSKFSAMLKTVCADGRGRGTLGYHVASTGRWGGRLWQPQNLPRVDADRDLPDVMRTLELLATPKAKADLIDSIELVTGKPMETLSKCLRAMLIAAPGKKFIGGDFSNIEGRVTAWVAGEERKLDVFRAYDAGLGPDVYKVTAAGVLGIPVADVSKHQRQAFGKVPELALGYQGSVGAFVTMGATYGVKAGEVATVSKSLTDPVDWTATRSKYSTDDSRGLDQETWTGVKLVVERWRETHPNITQAWWDLQDAALEAVGKPGMVVPVCGGRIKYLAANGFLFCSLPSGRVISYAMPRTAKVEMFGKERWQVRYDGVDSKTKRWGEQSLYGGKQMENIAQAISRDALVEAMFDAEEFGFELVLTVHDELLCENDDLADSNWTEENLRRIMSRVPEWAHGLPIAAATWEDYRYVK